MVGVQVIAGVGSVVAGVQVIMVVCRAVSWTSKSAEPPTPPFLVAMLPQRRPGSVPCPGSGKRRPQSRFLFRPRAG